jgi:gliding motility-associated-like protein
MKRFWIIFLLHFFHSFNVSAQNLVPNPSFELMDNCVLPITELMCAQSWNHYLDLDQTNTPDLGFEGAIFFPPSTIDAFDGDQYLNLEASVGNPEYAQVSLLSPMLAGITYCVSFYSSVTQESPEVAPSMGAYFTTNPLLESPMELGLEAHVQGPVDFDPTQWTLISGTYVAQGGEDVMVLSGFENTGTMPFPYMYIDMVSVVPMPPLSLVGDDLCDGSVTLNATAAGASYLWSTGATTPSIQVATAGITNLTRTIGFCTQQASVEILACDTEEEEEEDPVDDPEVPVDDPDTEPIALEEFRFFIPNAFTPDDDGLNDVFKVLGPDTDSFLLQIFNRWGQLVFESDNIAEPWMGEHSKGAHYVPDGIYIYRFRAIRGIEVAEAQGHVVVIR